MSTANEIPYKSDEQILYAYMIEVATLTGVLYAWMESDAYKPIYEQIADSLAGHDAQRGGCLRLSIAVMRILDRIIDWDARECGVFSYDQLEDPDRDVPLLLINCLTVDQWGDLAANYVIPYNLEALLTSYVRGADGLELKHDPERDRIIAKFCEEVDVPRAIGQRAYKKGWRKTA